MWLMTLITYMLILILTLRLPLTRSFDYISRNGNDGFHKQKWCKTLDCLWSIHLLFIQALQTKYWAKNHINQETRRRHDMGTRAALLLFCEGILPVTSGFTSRRSSNALLWCFFLLGCTSFRTNSRWWPMIWNHMSLTWRHCNELVDIHMYQCPILSGQLLAAWRSQILIPPWMSKEIKTDYQQDRFFNDNVPSYTRVVYIPSVGLTGYLPTLPISSWSPRW